MDHVPFEPTDRSSRLRADIRIGLDELDAGQGEELDIEELIRQVREEHGRAK
jgi:Arc/MetJ-type ribon-helix-helix transcriptional regulator